MSLNSVSRGLACGIVVGAIAVWSIGCTASKDVADAAPGSKSAGADDGQVHADHDQGSGEHSEGDGHNYGGWWCTEHGVPEKDCSVCSPAAAKRFKEKGDWCEEHGRAESQCFKCDPSKAEKFAKLYEAKFGKKPPQATD